MDSLEFVRLVSQLQRSGEQNAQLWQHLAQVFVTLMNTKRISVVDLMLVTRGFVNAKIRSEKLYGFAIRYYLSLLSDQQAMKRFDSQDRNLDASIYFFYSLAKACPSMSDNPEFFGAVNAYLESKMLELSAKQCEVCLDTWKFNAHFISDGTKALLVGRKNSLTETE